jgi:hypothetical protein
MLSVRGIGLAQLLSGAAFEGVFGHALALKLILVGLMIVYQLVVGHKRAPIAIYFDMLAALGVIGASVVLVRGWV